MEAIPLCFHQELLIINVFVNTTSWIYLTPLLGYLHILRVLLTYFIVLQLMSFYLFRILLFSKAIRLWTVYNYYL